MARLKRDWRASEHHRRELRGEHIRAECDREHVRRESEGGIFALENHKTDGLSGLAPDFHREQGPTDITDILRH